MTTLKQTGEFGLIERLVTQLSAQGELSQFGLGDDCAIIPLPDRNLLLSTDCLVSGRHFDLSFAAPDSVGYRALAINISDVAAMGGTPTFALISLQAPGDTETEQIELIYAGLIRCADQFGVKIVGGNVTSSMELALGVTIVGEVVGEPIRRSGAAVGDSIWVTGSIGGAAAGLRAARGLKEFAESEFRSDWMKRLLYPEPRVAIGQQLQRERIARAMIDISDGLVQDLGHITASSKVAAELDLSAVPVERGVSQLLSEGDDYELLFTVSPEDEGRLSKLELAGCSLTKIGLIVPTGEGNMSAIAAKIGSGYDHFL